MKRFKEKIIHDVSAIKCDICKIWYEDILELQEFTNIDRHCGYNSVFGDGEYLQIDICQHCLKQILKDHINEI
jgi:antitoxin CcdA